MNLPPIMMNYQKVGFKAKERKVIISLLILTFSIVSCFSASAQQPEWTENRLMIRIAEIEIDPNYLEEYKAILAEEASASVKLEPGVITIFPMYEKENPTQVRILEIYSDQAAYEQHLKTPHFQKYKTTTLKMVKSLKLVEMEAIDKSTMHLIFRKIKEEK